MSQSGEGIDASRELLGKLQGVLDGGSDSLEDMGRSEPPGIDAGESTTTVAETLGQLLQASAGVAGGMKETAQDVQTASERYVNNDDAAADLFGNER